MLIHFDSDTIDVWAESGLLHLPSHIELGLTACGRDAISRHMQRIPDRPADWAGIWCTECFQTFTYQSEESVDEFIARVRHELTLPCQSQFIRKDLRDLLALYDELTRETDGSPDPY